jgi:hypothetical protein
MNILNEPLDRLHAQCIELRDALNDAFTKAKERASTWEPRLCPPKRRTGL